MESHDQKAHPWHARVTESNARSRSGWVRPLRYLIGPGSERQHEVSVLVSLAPH